MTTLFGRRVPGIISSRRRRGFSAFADPCNYDDPDFDVDACANSAPPTITADINQLGSDIIGTVTGIFTGVAQGAINTAINAAQSTLGNPVSFLKVGNVSAPVYRTTSGMVTLGPNGQIVPLSSLGATTATSSTNMWLVLGGIGIGAFLLLWKR